VEDLELMLTIAREAAAIIDEVYRTPFDVEYKTPRDPVTEADRRANAHICARLGEVFPGIPVVAEESDPKSFSGFRRSERVFFVDPLDGTREFIKRNGEFVVMIGLLVGDRPRAAVLHAPATGVSWIGETGAGAFRIEPDGRSEPLRVSAVTELSRARILSTRSHRSPQLERALAALQAERVEPLGSAGLKCAEVAAGRAEAYVAPGYAGSRWDVCAGQALIEAAGGRVSDAFGDAFDYRAEKLTNDRGVIASNEALHPVIVERLARHRGR
jgi:3'(2'), 5'-bisphosphate nucleotidase